MFEAVSSLLDPGNLALMIAALAAGMVIGASPGLTSTVAIGLLIPFTFAMPKEVAFIGLLAIYCGSMFGGSIPAILLNLPGTPSSFITALDGYPLTKKGKGAEALAAAVISSTLGGLISCAFLIFLSLQLAELALVFSGPEYFALTLFAVAVVFSLTSESMLKGIVAVGLGLLLSTIGIDPTTGVPRFTFGINEILIGIPTVPATIALFCVAEGFRMIESPGAGVGGHVAAKATFVMAASHLRRLWLTIIKSSVIGTFIGILPGTGAVMSSLMAYGEARRASKHPEEFGRGALEGVSASETANNATTGGALIPLLTLGIPGDTNTLMLMGAMLVHGLIPGPTLFRDEADLVYVIFGTMVICNLLILPLGFKLAPYIARISLIDKRYLIPLVLVLSISGPAVSYGHIYYFWVAIIFGFLGYLCYVGKFPVLGIAMGLILGPILEQNLRSGLMLSDGNYMIFLTRPISLTLIMLACGVTAFGLYRNLKSRARRLPESEPQEGI